MLVEARQNAGIQQKELAAAVKKESGVSISASYLNDLEHDRRQPPSDHIIEQLAAALKMPDANFLYYFAGRFPPHLRGFPEFTPAKATQAFQAFAKIIDNPKSKQNSD